MKARLFLLGVALPLALAGAARAADADPIETQLRTQLRSTVTQLRELQDQQASLQAQKTAAEQERDALKKKGGGAAQAGPSRKALAAAAALRHDLAGARQEAEAQKQALAQAQAQLQATKQQLDQSQTSLRALQAQNEEMRTTLVSTNSTLQACEVKNVALIGVGNEILDRYHKVGLGTAMAAKEPFTGFKRVQLQNLAQGYENRLRAGRYDPRRDKAPPPAGPPANNVTEPSPH